MSTRSNICVVLPEDFDTTKKYQFNKDLIFTENLKVEGNPYNDHIKSFKDVELPPIEIYKYTRCLISYHHWDGYPKYLGKLLVEHYDTFEKAFNICLVGAWSGLHPDNPTLHADDNKPTLTFGRWGVSGDAEYVYKFGLDGQWYVTGWDDEFTDPNTLEPIWKPLKEYLAQDAPLF